LRAEHRPELAWQLDSSGQYCAPNPSLPAFSCPRPLWLLPQAQAIPSLAIVLDPNACERMEGGWWDGNDIARDYFRWRRADGAQCWVFRDCRSGRYFLHGYFA
jgi:protein ImuB